MIFAVDVKDGQIKCSIHHSIWSGLYVSTLLGGEFANCHGQGKTPEETVASLKIRLYQLRRKRK